MSTPNYDELFSLTFTLVFQQSMSTSTFDMVFSFTLMVKPYYSPANSAGGKLHLNTFTPFTKRSRSGLNMPLSRHGVGTCQETSSHATHQGTLSHSLRSSLSHG